MNPAAENSIEKMQRFIGSIGMSISRAGLQGSMHLQRFVSLVLVFGLLFCVCDLCT